MHLRHLLLGSWRSGPSRPTSSTFDDVVVGQVPLDAANHALTPTSTAHQVSGPTPCVVWINGGAGRPLANGFPRRLAQLLLRGARSRARPTAAANRRLTAQLHDLKGIVRHLRANSRAVQMIRRSIACWGRVPAESRGCSQPTGDVPPRGEFRREHAVLEQGPAAVDNPVRRSVDGEPGVIKPPVIPSITTRIVVHVAPNGFNGPVQVGRLRKKSTARSRLTRESCADTLGIRHAPRSTIRSIIAHGTRTRSFHERAPRHLAAVSWGASP